MKYEQFLEIYNAGPEATYKLLMSFMQVNQALTKRAEQLEERVEGLESSVNKNSRNSSKPPSTDEFVKPKSQRKKSSKSSGGQKGHKGKTLEISDTPDHRVVHSADNCGGCGSSLDEVQPDHVERRQVYDLPPLQVEVTEHLVENKICPCCGKQNKACFPEQVNHPVQYGNNIKGLLIYLNQYQLLPYERLVELFSDLFNHPISEGTLYNTNLAVYEALESTENEIVEQLIHSTAVHFDETGMRVEGKRQWMHVASTENLTHYAYHAKRGSDATDDIGILPEFNGTAVHDYWKSYLNYKCSHALCNAHHIRELTGIAESTGQQWPQEMIDLLLEIKEEVEDRKAKAIELTPEELAAFEQKYNEILQKGFLVNPPPVKEKGKRGRPKQSKAKNLLDRLQEHRDETLAFMYDFQVPFDNNLAERDLRMVKVKQKISGVFRSDFGAKMYCRIRGYISTARKNSAPVLNAIKSALEGKPFVPDLNICQRAE